MTGEAVAYLGSVAAGDSLMIRPSSADEEWIIHNVYHEGAATLIRTDGTNSVVIDSDTTGGAWAGFFFHVTYNQYLVVRNDDSSAKVLGYDGIRSK